MQKPTKRIMDLRVSLKELIAVGSPLDLSVLNAEAEDCPLEIRQVDSMENSIFELESGRVGCILDLTVVNQRSKPLFPIDVALHLPWKNDFLDWLTPRTFTVHNRKRPDSSYPAYRFTGKNGLQLEMDVVINHRVMAGMSLPPRRPISGLLLAMGGMMPTHLLHGMSVEAKFVITTSDHVEHCQHVQLWTERLEVKSVPARRSTGLYGNFEESYTSVGESRASKGHPLFEEDAKLADPRPLGTGTTKDLAAIGTNRSSQETRHSHSGGHPGLQ